MTPLEVGVWYSLPGIPNVVISLQKTSDFLAYPEWITQRNTKQRATKNNLTKKTMKTPEKLGKPQKKQKLRKTKDLRPQGTFWDDPNLF